MTRSSASPRPLWPFLVAAAAALVYVNSIANGFALDDIPLVRDNAGIRELSDAPRLFVSPYWPDGAVAGLYRPVTALSFLLTRLALGESAAGFHAVNVLLHALVAALVWLQARDVGVHYGTALVTAALFAVHPLHTEAVANVAGRAELLGALFVLAAWWLQRAAACRATPAGRAAVLVGAAACYLFAVLSKENTVLAPLLFALVERMSRDRPGRAGPGLGPVAAAYTAAFVAAMLLRVNALGGIRGAGDVAYLDNPAAFAGPAARVATALWVQLKYAWLFVWPARLSSDYSYNTVPVVDTLADPRLWAGLLFVVLLIAAFLFGRRRSAPVAIGVAIWAIFFLPVANLVFPVGTLMAERLAYLPSLGGCLVVGHLTAGLAARRRGYGRAVAAACLVAVVALSVRTVVRNGVWSSNASLALNDARVNPDSAKLHAGAGIAAFDLGERRRAEEAFRRAVEIYPDYAQVHFNLGQLLREEDRHAEAIEHLARAASLSDNPRPLQSLKELAVELEANGRAVDAVQAYAALERLLPSDYGTRFNHGRLLLALGQRQRASEVLSRLADDDAQGIPGQLAAALVAQLAGRPDEATRRFRELLTRRDLPPAIRARVEGLLAELEAD